MGGMEMVSQHPLQQRLKHKLKEALGSWVVLPQDYARHWMHLYSTTTDSIYHSTAFGYSIHKRICHDYDKDTDKYCNDLPSDAVPIEI